MEKPTRTGIKLLSPKVIFEGLTLHGLLKSVDHPFPLSRP